MPGPRRAWREKELNALLTTANAHWLRHWAFAPWKVCSSYTYRVHQYMYDYKYILLHIFKKEIYIYIYRKLKLNFLTNQRCVYFSFYFDLYLSLHTFLVFVCVMNNQCKLTQRITSEALFPPSRYRFRSCLVEWKLRLTCGARVEAHRTVNRVHHHTTFRGGITIIKFRIV